jgi:segregation and condensation protein B
MTGEGGEAPQPEWAEASEAAGEIVAAVGGAGEPDVGGAEPVLDLPVPEPKQMQPPSPDHIRLAEALVFASSDPVPARQLAAVLPEDVEAEAVLRAVQARFAGSGVELAEIAGGWQFRTAPDLAPRLTRVISRPRRLPRVAMETLAIIAWHQPVTRAQIEEIRGASLSQATLDALLEAGLVRTAGHREVPGRPSLWATTPQFLAQFGLKDLGELPKREELVNEQASVLGAVAPVDEPVAGEPLVAEPLAGDPEVGEPPAMGDEPEAPEA